MNLNQAIRDNKMQIFAHENAYRNIHNFIGMNTNVIFYMNVHIDYFK